MELSKKVEGGKTIVFIEGRIDTSTSPELDEYLINLGPVNDLVLDFEKVDYISSAGLRVLLSVHKRVTGNNGKLLVRKVNDVVRETFDVTGFLSFIKVE